MTASPNLGLTYMASSQSQKHVTFNDALRRLDALAEPVVQSAAVATPPGSPVDGQRWIVASSPTGAWAGQANSIAAWQDGVWVFYSPAAGWIVYNIATAAILTWSGSAWVVVSASPDGAITLQNKTLDNTNTVTLKGSRFTLQDDTDPTKQGVFQLAGLGAGVTRTYSLPNVSGLVLVEQPSPSLFSSTFTQTINLASGVTASGQTKTIFIGSSGASGSTTIIRIGSFVSGASVSTIVYGDIYYQQPTPTAKSAAATLTNAELQTGIIKYTGAAAALTLPLGTTLDSLGFINNTGLDFFVLNSGSGDATITANTGVTIDAPSAAVAAGASAHWRIRRTAASTYIAYRIAG